jgi:hypothetical protein
MFGFKLDEAIDEIIIAQDLIGLITSDSAEFGEYIKLIKQCECMKCTYPYSCSIQSAFNLAREMAIKDVGKILEAYHDRPYTDSFRRIISIKTIDLAAL